MTQQPTLVEVNRGRFVESSHRGCIAVANPDGTLHAQLGVTSQKTFMRSAAKPFQALPLLVYSAEIFDFDQAEIAVMAGSHEGEAIHATQVKSILNKIGLDKSKLLCGSHVPSNGYKQKPDDWSRDVLHHSCSGMHASILARCVASGAQLDTYLTADHPVQREVLKLIATAVNCLPDEIPTAVDGCSVPTFLLSVELMALAYARLANPDFLPTDLNAGCRRIASAMLTHPELVAGSKGRLCTDIMRVCGQSVIAKSGAEGVYTLGVLPCERYPMGLGVSLKIEDGGDRASGPAAVQVLDQLGLLTEEQKRDLEHWRFSRIFSDGGGVIGEVRAVFDLRMPPHS